MGFAEEANVMSDESKVLDLLFFAHDSMTKKFWIYAHDYQATKDRDSFKKMLRYQRGLNSNRKSVCKLIQSMASCKVNLNRL